MLKKILLALLCLVLAFSYLRFLWRNALSLNDPGCGYSEAYSEVPSTEENPQATPDPIPPSGKQETEPAKEKPVVLKGYSLDINLDNHLMYVYKNGIFIKTYPVSGGKSSTPSPVGTWRIISKDTWGEGFGGAWLGFNVPWGNYGIHGTVEPWFVGKSNSSKGCIRMRNNDVRELYKMVSHGTIVKIIQDNPSFRTMKSGDIGSDVLAVQKRLKALGYYNGSIDGRYGQGMFAGVKKFQKANRLYENGIVNKKTYNILMSDQLE